MTTIPIWNSVNPNTKGEMQELLFTIVTEGEGFELNIGQDGNGDVNIWYGYDLTDGAKGGVFSVNPTIATNLSSLNSTNFPTTDFTGTYINYTAQDASEDQATLGSIVGYLNEYTNSTIPSSVQTIINSDTNSLHLINDVTLTSGYSGSAFDLVQLVINRSISAAPVLQSIPATTYEQVALDDLAYNGGAGIIAGENGVVSEPESEW